MTEYIPAMGKQWLLPSTTRSPGWPAWGGFTGNC